MSYRVFIRDNDTGETRSLVEADDWAAVEPEVRDYMWAEGNYACDCNRALFFANAAGEDEPDHPCGDERYSVRIETLDGAELYADDDWALTPT